MQIPPELEAVIVLSVMNLGTVLAGFLIGRRADQAQKIVIGAFASGIAGVLFAGLLGLLGFAEVHPRSMGGVFVLSLLLGFVWTWLGYKTRRVH
jgi:hypothetical protein